MKEGEREEERISKENGNEKHQQIFNKLFTLIHFDRSSIIQFLSFCVIFQIYVRLCAHHISKRIFSRKRMIMNGKRMKPEKIMGEFIATVLIFCDANTRFSLSSFIYMYFSHSTQNSLEL